jgi:putative DNA-invertase from lambdoid prophage Rac
MKVAIYTRVSTERQDYENQLFQLREYCKRQGWVVYKEYSETISGKERDRPEFKKLLEEAAKHRFDAILVWALDRFTREGTERVWYYLSLLDNWNIKFISFQEPYLRTDNELARSILISVMGALAKQERLRISLRTKAGLEKARIKGVELGKPKLSEKVKEKIRNLREQGKSYREICNEVWYWDKSNNKHFVSMGFVHKTLSKNPTKNVSN